MRVDARFVGGIEPPGTAALQAGRAAFHCLDHPCWTKTAEMLQARALIEPPLPEMISNTAI